VIHVQRTVLEDQPDYDHLAQWKKSLDDDGSAPVIFTVNSATFTTFMVVALRRLGVAVTQEGRRDKAGVAESHELRCGARTPALDLGFSVQTAWRSEFTDAGSSS